MAQSCVHIHDAVQHYTGASNPKPEEMPNQLAEANNQLSGSALS